uniref:Hematopoietic SH2 domain containing n=1 Tax=Astyanax mexicanus TaxID=7994 RepID=A0A3B1IVZ7_ASTMX
MAVAVSQAGREAVLAWFAEYQRTCVVQNGIVPEWFHGIISRKEAEDMLMIKPPGYFLIRVSESRIGYTLSYKAEDRCRHFMIDMLPGNQYVIVGEKMHHRSLHDLVAFHRRTPILPFVEVLTVACGQVSKDSTDYAELMFPKRQVCPPGTDVRASSPRPEPNITEDPRPPLPACPPFLQQNSGTTVSPPGHPTRLYPSLDNELAALNIQDMVPPPRPVPRTKHLDTPPLPPPQRPPRSTSPHSASHTSAAEKKKGLPAAYIERPLPSPQPEDKDNSQKSQAEAKSARINLAQYKKIFQKKKNHLEEHTYIEINAHQIGKEPAFTEPNPQELGVNSSDPKDKDEPSMETSGALPIEYLNPPPFAPGY